MGPIVLLLSFTLLTLCQADGTPVFVQTGKNLLLDVKEKVTLEEDDLLTWSVNETKSISRYPSTGNIILKSYSGRAEYFTQNHSLLLKNVEQSDSGDYKAHVSGVANKGVAEHKVTVLDPVSPVNMTVNSTSSDSSNLTVTCSTQDSLISRTFTCFTCADRTCSDERGERAEFTTPGASLNVYLQDNSIICVHKNEVSRTEDVRKIEDFCKRNGGPGHHNNNVPVIAGASFGVLAFLLPIIGAVYYLRRTRKYKTENVENTVYEVPQGTNPNQTLEMRPMNDKGLTEDPSSLYHLVGNPTQPEVSNEARDKPLPESVYATVQKHTRF
ncbi:uncharacterized protein LOC117827361 [Notolabrus celidotus]|uniref:uncharacterized protein LOC117827361 n=1 Tax=Notolabrus celidotus TaxID=1203425 RepID=UPI0014906033|nr:uncharacterized protein LOC117827361 [Notolabrus celidotus]